MRRRRAAALVLSALLCGTFALGGLAACAPAEQTPGDDPSDTTDEPPTVSDQTDAEDISFTDLSETLITDDYAVNGLEKEIDYLLLLDADRLLANFYLNSSIGSIGSTCYSGGWENALIGGHTMGHYLTALSQAIANAGTSEEDREQLADKLDYIIYSLAECQENYDSARGAKEGFLWGARVASNTNVEIQFDNVEQGRTNINTEAWVPWYTMHKIIAGLLDAYTLAGNEDALTVVTKLGDWVYERVSQWSDATQRIVLSIEYGGMNDCLYNLYQVTGDTRYAVAAHKFDEQSLVNSILSEQANYLDGKHANTTIPKVIGLLNGFISLKAAPVAELENVAIDYLYAAELFWERVVEHHTYVTGGNSEWEHFGRDDVLNAERTNANCETCNTYNMLKLSRMLFAVTKDVKYLDFYEGTYYNAIWSSQNPETGMTTYFQPMASGYFKVYSSAENHFWCCTGSGMESFTKLNDSIYYDAGNATYVALYLDSTYTTDAVSLTQTADLENSDEVTIHIDSGATTLRLRCPEWTQSFTVFVNGTAIEGEPQDGFLSVDVSAGDEITVSLQKTVMAYNLPDGENVYAFKYGPFVLSAELGTENMTTTTTGVNVTIPAAAVSVSPVQVSSGTVAEFMENVDAYMVRGEDGKFTLTGTESEEPLTYSYHFRQYTQRYAIYMNFVDADEEVVEEHPAYSWERVDTVQPGYGQYETDELHDMQTDGSQGMTNVAGGIGTYRYAEAGGSFTYRMAVDKDAANRLTVYLAGEDAGKSIEIVSGDTVLYSNASLSYAGSNTTYAVTIDLPAEITQNAQTVSANGTTYDVIPITFRGVDGAESAKVCSFIYLDRFVNYTAYFVDCGDYNTATVSEGDFFGLYNSVTEQVYGEDAVTGYTWGLVDDHPDNIAGAPVAGKGFGTNSTWANEYISGDGVSKTESNRYTKNQYESGVARNLQYSFELPEGEYIVEMYFTDPWNCSKAPTVTANGEAIFTDAAVNTVLLSDVIAVSDGTLTLDITSDDLCINLCYIRIIIAA